MSDTTKGDTADIGRIDLDPLGGIAGDMFAAALLDAFPERRDEVSADLGRAGVPNGVTARVEEGAAAGFRSTRFHVTQRTDAAAPHTLAGMAEFLSAGTLSPAVREHALAIFHLLAEAEARAHGVAIEAAHFHEVSHWDSIVDVVAAASLIAGLPGVAWRVGPLPLGGGSVHSAHGRLPVPAPATLELLRGFVWVDDGVAGERVTPTGAAILSHLSPAAIGTPSEGALLRVGIGSGSRELPDRPNILRAIAYGTAAAGSGGEDELIERLAFEVDDMTGEELALALDRLRAAPGVVDACHVPVIGKKGRAAAGVRLMVAVEAADAIIDACFAETSTLGVRRERVRRRRLPRREVAVNLADGEARAKRARRPDGTTTAKVESDDLSNGTSLEERRLRAREIERRAVGSDGESDV